MRRHVVVLALAVVLVLGMVPMSAGAVTPPGYTPGVEYPVSLDDYEQVQPDIDYPWIVWKDCSDIFAYNFETDETRQITSGADAENPSISGDIVVFSDDYLVSPLDDGTCDIWVYDLTTMDLECITDGWGANQGNPAVEGDIVVFNDWTDDGDILGYDLSTDTAFDVAVGPNEQREPEIGDGWVVFKDAGSSISAYNISTQETRLVADGTASRSHSDASTDAGFVVYEASGYVDADPDYDYTICMYDLATDTETIIGNDNGAYRYHPVIGDGYVTWHDNRVGRYEVYLYDMTAHATGPIVEAVYDSMLGWVEYAGRTTTADGIVAWHDHRDEGVNSDGIGSYDDLYAMAIVGAPLSVTNESYTVQRDGSLVVDTSVVANDADPALVPALEKDVENGTLTFNVDGTFSYTPDADYMGFDSFTYTVTDGTWTGIGTVLITVANTPPAAVADAYSVASGSALFVDAPGVLGNDSDFDGDPLTARKVSAPAHGTVSFVEDGSFTYVPTPGYVGADSFTYVANDGYDDSAATTVNITVTPGSGPVSSNLVYRFYNRLTGVHFYTSSASERDSVLMNLRGTYLYEGVAFVSDASADAKPLYRFYNKSNNTHFYTASEEEKARVMSLYASIFTYEGTGFSVALTGEGGRVSVYRFFNLKNGSHFYTASEAEKANIIAKWPTIYKYEGIAYYVYPAGSF